MEYPSFAAKTKHCWKPKNDGVKDEFPFSKVMRFPGFMLVFGDVTTRASCIELFCITLCGWMFDLLGELFKRFSSTLVNQQKKYP